MQNMSVVKFFRHLTFLQVLSKDFAEILLLKEVHPSVTLA